MPRIFEKKGFTTLETMVVLGLTASMTLIGFTTSRELLPRYRTRKAAMEFSRTLELARQLAITSNQEVRVLMVEYDVDALDPEKPNRGRYLLQIGNASSASTVWDTLPVEDGPVDNNGGEGTFDLSKSSSYYLKGVSIEDWGTISGPGTGNADAIVFNPRGMLQNPSSDFESDGTLNITFVNKYSMNAGGYDRARVRVFRGGMIRTAFDGHELSAAGSGGSGFTSTVDDSEGDGYIDRDGYSGGDGGGDGGGSGVTIGREQKDVDDDVDEVVQEALDALNNDDSSSDDSSGDDSGGDDSSDDSSGDGSSDDGSGDDSSDDSSGDGSSDDGSSDDGSGDEPVVGGDGDPDDDPTIDEYLDENDMDREDLYEEGFTDDEIEEYFGDDGQVDEDEAAQAEEDFAEYCGCATGISPVRGSVIFVLISMAMLRRREHDQHDQPST